MNIWDALILLALLAAVVLGFRYLKKHGGSCDCGCEGCPNHSSCKKKD